MKALVLTLGHNSSAILVINGQVVGGYEEERLSGIKSDSAFPIKSIQQIQKMAGVLEFDAVYIGHWFTAGELVSSKYYDYDAVLKLVGGKEDRIFSIDNGHCTHHDSHFYAALAFARTWKLPFNESTIALVIDGFGTFGENLTVYSLRNVEGTGFVQFQNEYRVFDHMNSLGLMYQYATAYMGMKMNNHEYKMLGYEAHIDEVVGENVKAYLQHSAESYADSKYKAMHSKMPSKDTDPVVNISALDNVRRMTFAMLDNVMNGVETHFGLKLLNVHEKRVIISYFTQMVLELVVTKWINWAKEKFNFKNILLSGGVFYNVKLNKMITDQVEGEVCIYPLAGDQGAGLGVYEFYNRDLNFPAHLNWGLRDFSQEELAKVEAYNDSSDHPIYIANDYGEAHDRLVTALNKNGFVNFVQNTMEFGPRALGHTSTIAFPKLDVVETINELNDRTDVMPMAPFMTRKQFDEISKVPAAKYRGSLRFMITACELKDEMYDKMPGAAHKYGNGSATFRPQILPNKGEDVLNLLVEEFGPLINTSFNYHGVPIVYSIDDIIKSHDAQAKRAKDITVITVIQL